MQEKHNGWANRSTWLAALWLDNADWKITQNARIIAKKGGNKTALELQELLKRTDCMKESDFSLMQINWKEVREHLTA